MFPIKMLQDFSGKQLGCYLLSSHLGSGSAGTVYRATDTTSDDTSSVFAIKCIPKGHSARRLCQQIAELDNHSVVARCPNVIDLYETLETGGYFFLVLPLCELDLFKAIWKEKVFWRNDALIKKAFIEILDGVSACHKKGIFHRDLKPENIMCNADGTNIEIGDFGLSTHHRVCRDGRCGTNTYISPECWDEDAVGYYAKPLDIWSLGVILFNMVTSRYPWEEARATDEYFAAFLRNKDYLLQNYPISTTLDTVLRQIWHAMPMMRLPIPAIRQAILEMEALYRPPQSPCLVSPLFATEVVVDVDSQQTCVASPVEEGLGQKVSPSSPLDIPDLRETIPA